MSFPKLRARTYRWFALLTALLLVGAAVLLAAVDLPSPLSPVSDSFNSLVRNLITAAVLAALAYLWFYFWVSDRATHQLVKEAKENPEGLFPHPREPGSAKRVIGREALVEELASNLSQGEHTGPQIVVGETGAGKTSLLLALAANLASKREILPVVINLRDEGDGSESFDFNTLAVKRFHELLNPHVKSEAEADKLWRWMCQHEEVAILVDDLDRLPAASSDAYKAKVRVALDATRRRNLPLVVATRPSGLPPNLPYPPIDLAQHPLSEERRPVWERVLEQAGGDEGDEGTARKLVEDNIAAGSLCENPFYLELVVGLLRAGALPAPAAGGKHAVRLGLLDAQWDLLCGGEQVESEDRKDREAILRRVEALALAWLSPATRRDVRDWLAAIRAGEAYGLLYLDDQGIPRFAHEVLHAYFASRRMDARASQWLPALEQSPDSSRVQLALVLAAAQRGEDKDALCRLACEALLGDRDGASADQRLLRAAAAAEITRAGDFAGLDEKIAERCVAGHGEAGPAAKRAALEQVALLGSAEAVVALWELGEDPDYDTRWGAMERLVLRCATESPAGEIRAPVGADAYRIIEPRIQAALDEANALSGGDHDDWESPIANLKPPAWVLPSLRAHVMDRELRRAIEGQQEELLELERREVTRQRGLEASIAQGFKATAIQAPDLLDESEPTKMLKRARFWYSQLNLVHALSLSMACRPDRRGSDLMAAVGSKRLHPLLSVAVDLCAATLDERNAGDRLARMRTVVWDDEGAVVSGRMTNLTPTASQLVGEITVLLNLNETGTARQREEFGANNAMPYCLQRSRNRAELQSGCHPDCEFNLCPFRPVRDRPSAHREISRAFCRDQIHNAKPSVERRWGSKVTRRHLHEFWQMLERQARF